MVVDRAGERQAAAELELELIQSHMAQKPMLRGEVGCACVAREVSVERRGMGERGCARRLHGAREVGNVRRAWRWTALRSGRLRQYGAREVRSVRRAWRWSTLRSGRLRQPGAREVRSVRQAWRWSTLRSGRLRQHGAREVRDV